MVYADDPEAAPDSEFSPGALAHVVPGNAGRMLDQRRTPILITAVDPVRGQFELEVMGFEDAGARWQLPLEEIGHFQFDRSARVAPPERVASLRSAVMRFARTLTLEPAAQARSQSLSRVAAERATASSWLAERDAVQTTDLVDRVEHRQGDPELSRLLEDYLSGRGLVDLDAQLAATAVSNPRSGELVRAYAIVLAELGLVRYRGRVPREPDEPETKARRAEHLLVRLGFSQALWSRLGHARLTLYRGAAVDGPWRERAPDSFVSATFSAEVAHAHFEGGETAVMWRQEVPIERVLMTFLETTAMNSRFLEAEALLLGDPGNHAF